ncbi:MAG TPA: hypothetical protein VFO10_30005 [Oligoflexus sp.]|uniref:hypothetical protein n=1 Tax=Oligoflexus sp. TaxID=1971216 RepID=UPI002D7E167C|nr:hypothetical protein [Oligoflexus sp.]HET9241538.1 hypothetical protein [Oligoflexus sp.]
MKRLTFALLLYSTIVHGGGTIGGGNPPALEVDPTNMMDLQAGALADKLIQVKRPGSGYSYMVPLKDSIREYSMSARDLYSGDETVFQTSSMSERLNFNVSRSTARMVGSTIPAVLPILPDDFTVGLRPTVEVVSRFSLDETPTPQPKEFN